MKKYYAVIDTNVIVSALLKTGSLPWLVVDLVTDGIIIPVLSNEIIEEYVEVLSRPKFKFPKNKIFEMIEELFVNGLFVYPMKTDISLHDPDDVVFYATLLESKKTYSDSYLITGNIKDFPKDPFIVTPAEMLEIINSNK